MLINSLYGLSAPDVKIANDRALKVAEQIKKLGHKYLLSKPLPRIKK